MPCNAYSLFLLSSRPNPPRPQPIDAASHETLTLESRVHSQTSHLPNIQEPSRSSLLPATSLLNDQSQSNLSEQKSVALPATNQSFQTHDSKSSTQDEVPSRPPSLPPPAVPTEESPPRPPERPPKKPTLRSLFHGSGQEPGSYPQATQPQEIGSPETADIRRIEDTANELRNLSPGRPYFYRKPPAPDPPKSPEGSPSPAESPGPTSQSPTPIKSSKSGSAILSHIASSASPVSRSSTPDLPPPPPPPLEDEEVVCDEPLPPPPCEVSPESVKPSSPSNSPVDSVRDSVKPPPHTSVV